MNPETFSKLAASRHSVRDFRTDPVPPEVIEEILEDARQAPSWSNTRPFMVALATGEQADRLRAAYVEEFDDALPLQHKEPGAMARLALSGKAPDGDYPTWAPYPADLLPHSQAVGGRLYAHMGISRKDREARDAAARRNCEAFGAPVIGFVLVHEGLLPPGGPGYLAPSLRRRVRGSVGLPPHHGLRPGLRLRGPRQRLPGRAESCAPGAEPQLIRLRPAHAVTARGARRRGRTSILAFEG